jgi:hypothetical protein
MSQDPRNTPLAPPVAAEPRQAPPPYLPPAVAWEEPLEVLAATSCGAGNPFAQGCNVRPVV